VFGCQAALNSMFLTVSGRDELLKHDSALMDRSGDPSAQLEPQTSNATPFSHTAFAAGVFIASARITSAAFSAIM
jgi:hypothetical protein